MRNIRIPQVFTLTLKVFISNHLQWYKKETNRQNNDLSLRVLEAGLEPAQPQWPRDFKSLVSTDSTIRASFQRKSGKRDSNSRP